jgi:hypothetical protein
MRLHLRYENTTISEEDKVFTAVNECSGVGERERERERERESERARERERERERKCR